MTKYILTSKVILYLSCFLAFFIWIFISVSVVVIGYYLLGKNVALLDVIVGVPLFFLFVWLDYYFFRFLICSREICIIDNALCIKSKEYFKEDIYKITIHGNKYFTVKYYKDGKARKVIGHFPIFAKKHIKALKSYAYENDVPVTKWII